MRLVRGVGGVLAVVVWAACGQPGGGRDAGAGGDAGGADAGDAGSGAPPPPLTLLTGQVQPALIGEPYADKLTARNGVPPLSWSLPDLPAGLSWLSIDPARGTLSGQPPAGALGEQAFTAQVQDSADGGRISLRTLVMRLTECVEGASADCFVPSDAACTEGVRTCVDGGWGSCSARQGSEDLNACGASCGVCGPNALACDGGQCVCGAGPACSGGTPTCCPVPDGGGACADLQSDPDFCGGCAGACDAGARLHVARVCDGGTCRFPCVSSRYLDCNGLASDGCETDLQSPTTCGNCLNNCPPPSGGWATCDAGTCGGACPVGAQDCNNACIPLNSQSNCGGCGNVCPTSAPNSFGGTCVDAGCQLACKSGYANCDPSLTNGCETNVQGDLNNCGGCGNVCAYDGGVDGGAAYCLDGGCAVCASCGSAGLCCSPQSCVFPGLCQ